MRKIVSVVLFILIGMSVFSQDLVVFNEGDSLNCKIVNIHDNGINIQYINHSKIQDKSLAFNEFQLYKFGYYNESEVVNFTDSLNSVVYPKTRVSIFGGPSYYLFGTTPDQRQMYGEYIDQMHNAVHFGADYTGYFDERHGLGVKLDVFNNSAEQNATFRVGEDQVAQKITNTMTLYCVGAVYSYRFIRSDSLQIFYINGNFGYVNYREDFGTSYLKTIYAHTFSFGFDFKYDFRIAENLYLNLGTGISFGAVNNFTTELDDKQTQYSLVNGQMISLVRYQASIGLSFSMY